MKRRAKTEQDTNNRALYVESVKLRGLCVLLRIAIEFVSAFLRAKIERSAVVFSRSFGIILGDLHSAYRIGVGCTGHAYLLLLSIAARTSEMSPVPATKALDRHLSFVLKEVSKWP